MLRSKVLVISQEPPPSKLDSFLDACSKPDAEYELASRPNKRRKLIDATSSDADTFPPRAENPYLNHLKPDIKPRRSKKRTPKGFEGHNADFLTLARVDIDLAFASTQSRNDASKVKRHEQEALQVLLKSFERSPADGTFRCLLTTLQSDTLFEITSHSRTESTTLDILQNVVSLSVPRKSRNMRSICLLWKVPGNVEDSVDHRFRLCCKVLISNANDYLDGLPLNRKNAFDRCVIQASSKSYDDWKPMDFYDHVHLPSVDEEPFDSQSTDQLLGILQCQLYPFQKRALQWLLRREGVHTAGGNIVRCTSTDPERAERSLPHGFIRTEDADGTECFISHCLGIVTKHRSLLKDTASQLRGGILAEEMGLGKTVEMIALISLHKRGPPNIADFSTCNESTVASSATLIITPPAILEQWKNEIGAIAPHLKVLVYEGIRTDAKTHDDDQRVARLAEQDIILTTYNVLGREIHYAAGAQPDRNLRKRRRYERKQSPLTKIDWWRVVLDEAQMVESGVSNAAKVAQLIPRQNAWAVSGTPVKKDAKDLYGLLIFLHYQPYCSSTSLWDRLIAGHRDIFWQIFGDIALRHTKDQIKGEILLPPQTRVVINVPFTQVEEQHYATLFQEMCADCGVDLNGTPLKEDWDPNSPGIIEKMRIWLSRLRQTCLHPEVGLRNRKALGSGKGPLRTVAEVLSVMIEHNDTANRTEERCLLLSRTRKGQVLEHKNCIQDALSIWQSTLSDSKEIVDDCRDQLNQELNRTNAESRLGVPDEDSKLDRAANTRAGLYRQRLRSALEVQHICTFFIANAYYQIKCSQEPGSEAHQKLEKAEERTYEEAKNLRQELLLELQRKADLHMNKVREALSTNRLVDLPDIKDVEDHGGIESRNLLAKIDDLIIVVNKQAKQLIEWRRKLVDLVLLPLVDKDDSGLQGDEYEISTQQQDEAYVYMDAFRAIVSDRHDILTGQTNERIKHEMKIALERANASEGHSPELMKKLLLTRQRLLPDEGVGSVRSMISELRELRTTLRSQLERGNARAGMELQLLQLLIQAMRDISDLQSKIVAQLEPESEMLKNTVHSRLEYYKQLQHISDTVAPFEEDLSDEEFGKLMGKMENEEVKLRDRVATLKARGRYLIHLRDENLSTDTQRQCIICREQFERGVLTSCGHSYCVECIRLWWQSHKNCPTCKKHLLRSDFHQISYKPQELTVQETPPKVKGVFALQENASTSIYAGITRTTLDQIKNIDLDGSFGTKIDTLARHILWIRQNDPGAKSVMFSQYKDFLTVLGRAFAQFKIAFQGFDKPNGVRKFKDDPGMECFFLHAKAQASGLNLVNATHVFLCEPLINTAIELQAIARVHRIGQQNPTTVWMYLVEDSVEKSIYEISVDRRMSHIARSHAQETSETMAAEGLESQIEAANTTELQEASLSRLFAKGTGGGELVGHEHVWECLFRHRPLPTGQGSTAAEGEVGRHLRTMAAEERQGAQHDTVMAE